MSLLSSILDSLEESCSGVSVKEYISLTSSFGIKEVVTTLFGANVVQIFIGI